MTIITIPKKLAKEGDLIVISRKEYERLLRLSRKVKEIEMTPTVKRALSRARKNLKEGKAMSIYELKQKLGIKN